jgi:hypothetical protein
MTNILAGVVLFMIGTSQEYHRDAKRRDQEETVSERSALPFTKRSGDMV